MNKKISRREAIGIGAGAAMVGWALRARAAEKSSSEYLRISTDFPSLQAAVDGLPNGMGEILIPPGNHILEEPLNLTRKNGYGGGLILRGAGPATVISCRTKGKPAFDLTGSSYITLRDMAIDADNLNSSDQPSVGLLLARRADAVSSQEHRFENLFFRGSFKTACVYCITSELNRFSQCIFIQKAPKAHCFVYSADNFAGLESPFVGKLKENHSNTEQRIEGSSFYNWGEGGTCFYMLGFSMDVTLRDCYMNPGAKSEAGIFLGMSRWGGPCSQVFFEGLRIEGDQARSIFKVQGRVEGMAIRDSTIFYGAGRAIDARNASASHLTVQNTLFWNVRGTKTAMEFGSLRSSRIDGSFCRWDNWANVPAEEGPPIAVKAKEAVGNEIWVENENQVQFGRTSRQNQIVTVGE